MKTETEISETRTTTTEQGVERHHTTVISRQDWDNSPSNGIYAGKSYRITTYYTSNAAGYRHVMRRSTSEPWDKTLPAGLTSFEPLHYGERRWNGTIWPSAHVDRYNAELSRIATRHRAGMDTQHLINGLYNLAAGFDAAGKGSTK